MAANVPSHEQSAAQKFLSLLFALVLRGYIELRPIRPGSGALQPAFFPVTDPAAVAARAVELRDSADVYFGAATREERSGKGSAVRFATALWADIDSDVGREGLKRFELEPSIIVGSGSGENVHAYWLLAEPIPADEAEALMRALALRIGSDPHVTDRARILRVPGTLNYKHHPPTSVTLERCEPHYYTLDELRSALDVRAADDGETAAGAAADSPRPADDWGAEVSDPVRLVLGRLAGVRGQDGQWKAHCPAHDDQRPSLSVGEAEDGTCLINCFAGCKPQDIVTELGLEMSDLFVGNHEKRVAVRLMREVERQGLQLFHAAEVPYASMKVNGHLQTWPVKSAGFELQLRRIHFKSTGEGLRDDALREATATLGAKAIFDGIEKPVFHRVAGLEGKILFDLGDAEGRAVEVDAKGWRLLEDHGVPFIRKRSDLPFPVPAAGGSIEELRDFTNCANEASFKLFVGAAITCLHPTGPYLLIYITGEQGSAKSTHAKLLASLVDPRRAPLVMGTPPVRDLAVIANGVRLVGFDNVSYIREDFSNALCQLVSGAGHRTRELYTDAEQSILEAKLPVQMNGIGNVIKRPDLQERVGLIELKPITPQERRTEEEFWAVWEEVRPRIFGAILDGLSSALAHYKSIELDGYPRLADCARWNEAAGLAYGWQPGTFTAALEGGQLELLEGGIEGHPELEALLRLIDEDGAWEGTPTELLSCLGQKVVDEVRKGRFWPKRPDVLSKRLDEFAPLLRAHGIEVVRERIGGGNRTRIIRISRIGDAGTPRDA